MRLSGFFSQSYVSIYYHYSCVFFYLFLLREIMLNCLNLYDTISFFFNVYLYTFVYLCNNFLEHMWKHVVFTRWNFRLNLLAFGIFISNTDRLTDLFHSLPIGKSDVVVFFVAEFTLRRRMQMPRGVSRDVITTPRQRHRKGRDGK